MCLNLLGRVKTLIFLLRMMSQMSNLHTLLIYISTIMIFSLRLLLPFYYSCFITAFRKGVRRSPVGRPPVIARGRV